MAETPRVLIIAGPNGAGKTTFATEYLLADANIPRFVNADLIASGLSPFEPSSVGFRAGRLMLQMINELTKKEASFAIETTLSGGLYRRWISLWHEVGYYIELHFLYLNSADLAISRVMARVRSGGHNVPDEIVRRRYKKGWRNFEEVYRDLVDEWTVYDNSGSQPVILASGVKG
ncbi:MAG: zeta toxin family protein [Gammaproteobacteria bacterium]|nr:zeta toxin family protein [Gammaproteobacteria bacterium]